MRRLLALLLVATPAVFAGARVSLELLPQARVAGRTVLLGEVATLHCDDLALMRKLVHLPLGRSPQAGEVSLLQREQLAAWLRRQAGVTADQVAWSGATESHVLRVTPMLRGEDIARVALDAVGVVLASSGQGGRVQVRIAPRDVDLPGSNWRIEIRGLETGLGRRRPLLWADIWSGDAFVRTVPVALDVASDTSDSAAMAPPDGAPPLQHMDPERAWARETSPPVVARGDWATLRSTAGPILVEGRVEVLQDGRPGQKIRVRQQGVAGTVFARVLGHGQLELAP
jgi:flagellar basal body P-ring formation protein FlgA